MSLRSVAVLVLVVGLLPISRAAARGRAVVVAERGGARAGAGPIQARVGDEVVLRVALTAGPRGALAPVPEGARVRWLRVVPRLEHVDLPWPNRDLPAFSNAVLGGPSHGRWLGYDRLEYEERPLEAGPDIAIEGGVVTLRAAHPLDAEDDTHGGAGSIWIAAEITLPDGTIVRTPDVHDTDRFGLSARVMRVSFRAGHDFLGWLATYFNVPDVFGSNGPQPERYVGADCADVLVGAMRASGRTSMRYTSVSGIGRYADVVGEPLRLDRGGVVRDELGREARLAWGTDVRPGDLVAIDYASVPAGLLPRAWDHIGALVRDADQGRRGVLDGADLLRHMGRRGLTDAPLTTQGAIRLRIWRWKRP